MKQVVLIGGTGRCGTNLIKNILNIHSKTIAFPFEYRFTIDPDGLIDFYKTYLENWSPFIIDKRIKRLEQLLKDLQSTSQSSRYQGWELDKHIPNFNDYIRQLIDDLVSFSYQGKWVGFNEQEETYVYTTKSKESVRKIFVKFMNNVVNSVLSENDADIFIEDNTWNILFAKELKSIIPYSRLLHIYRDPRDVVASFIKQKWAPNDLLEAALWYKDIIDEWFVQKTFLSEDYYYEFKLENLVSDPEITIKTICDFLDIEYEEGMINIDLSKSNSGRWKDEFNYYEKDTINKLLEEYIVKLEYE